MPNLAVVEVSSKRSDTEALDKEVRPEVAVRVPPRVTLPEILAVPPTSSIVSVKPPALMPNLAVVEVSSKRSDTEALDKEVRPEVAVRVPPRVTLPEILAVPPTSSIVSVKPPALMPNLAVVEVSSKRSDTEALDKEVRPEVAVRVPPRVTLPEILAVPPTSSIVSVKPPALMPNLAVVEVSSKRSDTEALDKEVRPEVAVRVPPRVTLPEILAVPPTSSIVSVKPPALMANLAVVEVSSKRSDTEALDKEVRPEVAVRVPPRVTLPEILAVPPTSSIVSVKAPALMPNLAVVEVSSNLSDTEALDKEVRPEVAVRVPPRVTLPEILAVRSEERRV